MAGFGWTQMSPGKQQWSWTNWSEWVRKSKQAKGGVKAMVPKSPSLSTCRADDPEMSEIGANAD